MGRRIGGQIKEAPSDRQNIYCAKKEENAREKRGTREKPREALAEGVAQNTANNKGTQKEKKIADKEEKCMVKGFAKKESKGDWGKKRLRIGM